MQTHDLCDTSAVLYQLSYLAAGHIVSHIACEYNCDDQSCLHFKYYQCNKRSIKKKKSFVNALFILSFH